MIYWWSLIFICDDKVNIRFLICYCIVILLFDISNCVSSLCLDLIWNGIGFVYLIVLGNYFFFFLFMLLWLMNRLKIFLIVNLLWVSIFLEEVIWWKVKVVNEFFFRLELFVYLNWNKFFLFIFYICKSKIKNFLLVWFMKFLKMVYEMVIDRNNFLLIMLFYC